MVLVRFTKFKEPGDIIFIGINKNIDGTKIRIYNYSNFIFDFCCPPPDTFNSFLNDCPATIGLKILLKIKKAIEGTGNKKAQTLFAQSFDEKIDNYSAQIIKEQVV